MEDKESRSWVEVLPMIQSVANGYPHPASGITSEQALFGFQPRRPSDLIHANVKSLPEGMLRNNFETNQKLLDELRASMLDQHQAAAEEMAARMAVRYRDLPESWGMDDRTWYVYLIIIIINLFMWPQDPNCVYTRLSYRNIIDNIMKLHSTSPSQRPSTPTHRAPPAPPLFTSSIAPFIVPSIFNSSSRRPKPPPPPIPPRPPLACPCRLARTFC
eukprot:SAG11_NODE_2509_length_3270_cov_4.938190_5_plen_216_part_00